MIGITLAWTWCHLSGWEERELTGGRGGCQAPRLRRKQFFPSALILPPPAFFHAFTNIAFLPSRCLRDLRFLHHLAKDLLTFTRLALSQSLHSLSINVHH